MALFQIQSYDAVHIGDGGIDLLARDYVPIGLRGYIQMRKSIMLFNRLEKSAPAGIKPEHKAKAAAKLKAAGATRWITVHPPDGDKSRPGVPVMIKDHGDGTAHVVGGAGGKLNMLKLRGIKTPEEYRDEMDARRQAEREKRQEEKAAERRELEALPESQQERIKAEKRLQSAAKAAAEADLAERQDKARKKLIEEMSAKLGWPAQNPEIEGHFADAKQSVKESMAAVDPDDTEQMSYLKKQLERIEKFEKRAKKDYENALISRAKQVIRQVQEEALADPDVKAELEDVIKEKIIREEKQRREDNAKGFATEYGQSAEAKGDLTDPRLRKEKKENFDARMEEIIVEKKNGEMIAKMIRAAVATNQEYSEVRHAVMDEVLGEIQTEAPRDLEAKADLMKAYLEMRKIEKKAKKDELKTIEQINLDGTTEEIVDQIRKELDYGDGLFLGSLDEDFSAELEFEKRKIENERMGAVNTALLDAVEENDRGRLKYTLNGVYNGLNAAVLSITKNEGLNRDVVDILGLDNAAKLTAHMLADTLSAEDFEDARVALEEWHAAENEGIASDALDRGQEYLAKARELQVEIEATNPDEIKAIERLEKQRLAHLDEANRIMAQAVGSMEATAALAQAMKVKRRPEELVADMGDSINGADAIVRARALGLTDDEYTISMRGGHRFLCVAGDAIDKLRPTVSREDVQAELDVAAIKSGAYDEDDWVPDGLEKRIDASYSSPAATYSADIESQSLIPDAGEAQESVALARQQAYEAAHRVLGGLPEGGLAFLPPEDMTASQQHDLRQYWETQVYAGSMAEGTAERQYQVGKGTTKRKEWNAFLKGHETEHGAFEAIKADLIANHSEEDMFGEKITPRLARVIPGDHATYDGNVPGAADVFQQYYDMKARSENPDGGVSPQEFKAFEKQMPETLEGLYRQAMQDHALYNMKGLKDTDFQEGGRQEQTAWGEYVRMHGGPENALSAVQDIVKGKLIERFVGEHAKLAGVALKTEKQPIRNARDHVLGLLPKDARDSLMNRVQAELSSAGARVANRAGGKFATGSWRDRAYELLQSDRMEAASQMSMFGDEDVKQEDGTGISTIGPKAEAQLAEIVGELSKTVRRGERYGVAKGFHMSNEFADKQRAIKMLDRTKKMNMTFGTGKGKSVIAIGAYSHLAAQGKVKRAVFAVPSVVQAQFGSEINKFATPGKFKWFNTPGVSREERIAAMKDPSNNMVMMTHQSLRDDLMHLVSGKIGKDGDAAKSHFNGLSRDARRKLLAETMQENGINFEMGVVDESHYTASRKGKPDTTLSNVLQALTDNTEYFLNQSATPVKNDASEAFDMLAKVDPQRFNDRSEFLKRYGVDTEHSKTALRRLINRYNYASPTVTGVKRSERYETVGLTDTQRKAYEKVEAAAKKASKAARAKSVDVEAMKTLSPNSFRGVPEERHEEIARKLQPAVGTIKEEALNRVVNQGDWKSNAKVNRLVEIVNSQVYDADNPSSGGKAGSRSPGVIFAHNLQTVDNITQALQAQGLRVGVIKGDMGGVDKEKVKVGFNPPDPSKREYDVMVLSDAGATGLNLQNARYLVNFDQPHTSWVREQRMGRIDRHGQAHPEIDYYDIVSDTEHEKKKIERVKRKAKLGQVFQVDPGDLDDTGLAERIKAVREARRRRDDAEGAAA